MSDISSDRIVFAGRDFSVNKGGPKAALRFACKKLENGGAPAEQLAALRDQLNAAGRQDLADQLDDALDRAGLLGDVEEEVVDDGDISDDEIERIQRQLDELGDDQADQANGKPCAQDQQPQPDPGPREDFDPTEVEPDPAYDQAAADEAEFQRLAELPTAEYERQRKAVAERLGMRVGVLDKLVALHQPGTAAAAEKAKLVAIAVEHLELWSDYDGETYATVKEHGPACTLPARSTDLRRRLLRLYGETYPVKLENGDEVPGAPNSQAVREALDQFDAIARGNTPTRRPPGLRSRTTAMAAWSSTSLTTTTVIHVSRHGWEVTKLSPVPMRRADGMRALPVPDAGCAVGAAGRLPLDQLRELLGYADAEHAEEWALLVGFLFATFQPTGPKPVLVLSGEQGSGKTTVIRALRRMVDPHKTAVQSRPKSEQDLFVNGNGQWLIGYDNLSAITPDWSDAFCRVATGATWSGRRLYTDGEVVQYEVCRPQIITSIVDAVSQPDLLDRSLLVALPTIPEERRREEPALLRAVDDLVPAVLGQLLDATVEALDAAEDLEVSYRPRMVGLVRWVESGADHLGLEPDQFSEAYRSSHGRASEIALDSSMVGLATADAQHPRPLRDAGRGEPEVPALPRRAWLPRHGERSTPGAERVPRTTRR